MTTILGNHEPTELSDLVKAKDFDIVTINSSLTSFDPQWQAADPVARDVWVSDWNAFRSRYDSARAVAMSAIASPDLTNGNVEAAWNAFLEALTPSNALPSFQSIYNRYADAIGHNLDFSKQPQPTKGSDSSLAVFQTLDKIKQAIDASNPLPDPKSATPILLVLGGGILLGLLMSRR